MKKLKHIQNSFDMYMKAIDRAFNKDPCLSHSENTRELRKWATYKHMGLLGRLLDSKYNESQKGKPGYLSPFDMPPYYIKDFGNEEMPRNGLTESFVEELKRLKMGGTE